MPDGNRNSERERDEALQRLRATVVEAIDGAHKEFADIMAAAGMSEPPPPRQFFASCVMQLAYCLQCGAEIGTFRGGDPKAAWYAIKNAVDISNHYWGSTFELRSDSAVDGPDAASDR